MKNNYEKEVLSYLPKSREFKPIPFHNKDGDCIEFLAKPDPYFAKRINNLVTVYHSQETDEVIGFMIKGYARIKEYIENKIPGFAIEIRDGKVRLGVLFKASWWSSIPADQATIHLEIYEKLNEYAESVETELVFV